MCAWPSHLINCLVEKQSPGAVVGWGVREEMKPLPVARMPSETLGLFSSAHLQIPTLAGLQAPSHPCGGSALRPWALLGAASISDFTPRVTGQGSPKLRERGSAFRPLHVISQKDLGQSRQ